MCSRDTVLSHAVAIGCVSAVLGVASARAGSPSVDAISVQPAEIVLQGSRATQRVLVTGRHGSSSLESDLTALATYESLDPAVATVTPEGMVSPRGPGQATLVVRYAGHEERVRVRVERFGPKPPVDFRTEVVAALGRGGCNQGACHGSPQGKGGFRLSLRGFDPELDFVTLTREAFGRRTDVFAPRESLDPRRKPRSACLIKEGAGSRKTTPRTGCCTTGSRKGCRPSPAAVTG